MRLQKSSINQRGQALITLLVFMIIGLTITSAAMVMILVNSNSGSKQQQGELAYQIAQSGAENAVLRKIRNPAYAGEILAVGSGSAEITVTGLGTSVSPYVIISTGTLGNFKRKVEVTAQYDNNLFQITSERERFN